MKAEEALVLGAGALVMAGGVYWLVTREVEAEEPEEPAGSIDFTLTIS